MEIQAKFSVLFYTGKKGTKKQKYECPDFEDIITPSFLEKGKTLNYTAVEQADNWLSEIDKKEWMEANDIQIIFDWEIISCKQKTTEKKSTELALNNLHTKELITKAKKFTNEEIVEIYVNQFIPEALKNDFIAVYETMKDQIKGMKYKKQIDIVMAGMKVAYRSSSNVFDRLNEIDEQIKADRLKRNNSKILDK